MKISSCWKIPTATASASCRSQARTEQSSRQTRPEARVIPVQPVVRVLSRPRVAYPELSPCSEGMGPRVHLTAGCGDIDPCRSPCTCERLSTPSTEGYARIMLRGSTTLKTADDQHDIPMPMDYFVWAAVSSDHTVVVDTGFSAEVAARRGREHLRRPADGLEALGIDCTRVPHVVLTHLHYDHIGNLEDFPAAPFVVQEEEMAS